MFGDDYDTPDGTGVRDYIHVVDLAVGHVKAVEKLADKEGVSVYNLGTGNGYSVLQVFMLLRKPADTRSNTRSKTAVRVTSPCVTVILPKQRLSWAGRRSTA